MCIYRLAILLVDTKGSQRATFLSDPKAKRPVVESQSAAVECLLPPTAIYSVEASAMNIGKRPYGKLLVFKMIMYINNVSETYDSNKILWENPRPLRYAQLSFHQAGMNLSSSNLNCHSDPIKMNAEIPEVETIPIVVEFTLV